MKKVSNGSSSKPVKFQPSVRLVLLVMAVGVVVLLGVALSPPQAPSEKSWFSRIFGSTDDEPSRRLPVSGRLTTTAESTSKGISDQTSDSNPFASRDIFTSDDTLIPVDAANPQTLDPERVEDASEQQSDDAEPEDLDDNDLEKLSISSWVRTETGDPVPNIEVSSLLKRSFATAQSEASAPGQRRLTVRTPSETTSSTPKMETPRLKARR